MRGDDARPGALRLAREALSLAACVAGAALVLYLADVGCVFRLVTGVPCPGCGMTRAWLSVLRLDLAAAVAYHPFFWLVPVSGGVVLLGERRSAAGRSTRGYHALLVALIAALVVVWGLRLADPRDAGMFLGWVPEGVPADVIHINAGSLALRLLAAP